MAFINYADNINVPQKYVVGDEDHIVQISAHNPRVMKLHYDFYLALMRKKSTLSRIQRESIAVRVSQINACQY